LQISDVLFAVLVEKVRSFAGFFYFGKLAVFCRRKANSEKRIVKSFNGDSNPDTKYADGNND
jgi:hypothetical protein